jgi:hypothetical protein
MLFAFYIIRVYSYSNSKKKKWPIHRIRLYCAKHGQWKCNTHSSPSLRLKTRVANAGHVQIAEADSSSTSISYPSYYTRGLVTAESPRSTRTCHNHTYALESDGLSTNLFEVRWSHVLLMNSFISLGSGNLMSKFQNDGSLMDTWLSVGKTFNLHTPCFRK